MFKLLCVCAILAVVAAFPAEIEPPAANQDGIAQRDGAAEIVGRDAPGAEVAVEAQDDMDKAETFGFGYHKYIHVYPRYYPRYYYSGFYPRYYYGHYGHYW